MKSHLELIYLFEELFGQIVFSIGEYKFQGIRPFHYMELPWNTHDKMNEYMNSLEKENTPYSYKKFIYWDEQQHYQMIHILLRRSYLCLAAGKILIMLSVLLMLSGLRSVSLFALIPGIISLIFNKYFKYRAKKYYFSVTMSQEIFKMTDTWMTD
jgi:hypothetical protein